MNFDICMHKITHSLSKDFNVIIFNLSLYLNFSYLYLTAVYKLTSFDG